MAKKSISAICAAAAALLSSQTMAETPPDIVSPIELQTQNIDPENTEELREELSEALRQIDALEARIRSFESGRSNRGLHYVESDIRRLESKVTSLERDVRSTRRFAIALGILVTVMSSGAGIVAGRGFGFDKKKGEVGKEADV